MDEIEQTFRRYGYEMPENNRRQAYVPAGSLAISNPVGTAPAFIKEIKKRPVICLPGVPRELKYLMGHEVIPWVRKRFDLADHIVSYRVLKVVGISESGVDRLIGDLMRPGQNPEVGLLASQGEIKIRIAARSKDERETNALFICLFSLTQFLSLLAHRASAIAPVPPTALVIEGVRAPCT